MADPMIVWFRQDLRVGDHPALAAAAQSGRPVIPVYVLDDAVAGHWSAGGASRWWLHHSLNALSARLQAVGSRLILRRGDTVAALLELAAEVGARTIHLSRAYEPFAASLERSLQAAAGGAGVEVRRYSGSQLFEPEAVRTHNGEPFCVFTPFWRAALAVGFSRSPLEAPQALSRPRRWPAGDDVASWQLLPTNPDWAGGLRATWQPGEAGAIRRLTTSIDGPLARYAQDRDRPDISGTSMLSPHLHFGEISPRQCWQAIDLARERDPRSATGAASLLRQLGWREFSCHLLHHWPTLPQASFRPAFDAFAWEADEARLKSNLDAWSRGRTGYPIVDAGMRQLWHTGWMHNRVRMIAASFLTKHLLVPWQSGARWFWDTLVDADLANNSAGWQWVAGSGADAAPYFRIFNPVLQARKFDPDGSYVRRWVPEIARLPVEHLHAPWEAPPATLRVAGVQLGTTYPSPIVDHDAARKRALAAYARLRMGGEPAGARD